MADARESIIRRDWDRLRLRELLLDGARSHQTAPADAAWFSTLRARVREAAKKARRK